MELKRTRKFGTYYIQTFMYIGSIKYIGASLAPNRVFFWGGGGELRNRTVCEAGNNVSEEATSSLCAIDLYFNFILYG